MTYRIGAYVYDAGTQQIGRVMEARGDLVHLRPPHGGREWTARPEALRLASRQECEAAGVRQEISA